MMVNANLKLGSGNKKKILLFSFCYLFYDVTVTTKQQQSWAFFVADILTGHSRNSEGFANNVNEASFLLTCLSKP